jgi:hypothetical protein
VACTAQILDRFVRGVDGMDGILQTRSVKRAAE